MSPSAAALAVVISSAELFKEVAPARFPSRFYLPTKSTASGIDSDPGGIAPRAHGHVHSGGNVARLVQGSTMNTTVQAPVKAIPPAVMHQAGVPLSLALWYHTQGSRKQRLNLIDALRIDAINSRVRALPG